MNPKFLSRRAGPLVLSLAAGLAVASPKTTRGAGPSPAQAPTARAPAATPAPAKDPHARELLEASAAKLASLRASLGARRRHVTSPPRRLQGPEDDDGRHHRPQTRPHAGRGERRRRRTPLRLRRQDDVGLRGAARPLREGQAPPPTLSGTALDALTSEYDFELPLTDLLYMASGTDPGAHATEAGVIGTSVVDGVECEHLAFRSKKADWQVWIDKIDLLPKKVAITTRDQPGRPNTRPSC